MLLFATLAVSITDLHSTKDGRGGGKLSLLVSRDSFLSLDDEKGLLGTSAWVLLTMKYCLLVSQTFHTVFC